MNHTVLYAVRKRLAVAGERGAVGLGGRRIAAQATLGEGGPLNGIYQQAVSESRLLSLTRRHLLAPP